MAGGSGATPTAPVSGSAGGMNGMANMPGMNGMTAMPGMAPTSGAGTHTSGSGMAGMPGMSGTHLGGMHMSRFMWMPSRPPTLGRLLAWHPQPLPVMPLLCLLLAGVYLYAVLRLHRRGDRWPIGRTVCWLLGLLTILLVTATGVGGYSMELFSVHMVQHMTLSMLTPILLLLGAPITLALRALPVASRRGGRGPREVLLAVVHSRVASFVTSPFFTLPVFVASLYGLYLTPLFDTLMSTWWGHGVMMLHFIAVGLLFFYPILGIDPSPTTRKPIFGILELFSGMPFHAFFGIAVMMSSTLIVHSFRYLPAGWPSSPIADQRAGGALAWAFSEIPTIVVLLAVFVRWHGAEDRAARRTDRAAERDNDAELEDYNAYLASLDRYGRAHDDAPAAVMTGQERRTSQEAADG